jgi:hypothetical protein
METSRYILFYKMKLANGMPRLRSAFYPYSRSFTARDAEILSEILATGFILRLRMRVRVNLSATNWICMQHCEFTRQTAHSGE